MGDQLGQAVLAKLDGDHVGEAYNPDFRMVKPLLDVFYLVNAEQFGVQSPLIEVKVQLV